ncbi:MAG: histone [Thermoproteota archaeon]|nr:MAG: histone [Candidatus Korarchaeota archaeon]
MAPKKAVKHLPLAPIYRIIKDAGAERVSDEARVRLAYHMERFATAVSKRAVELAKHAKRKTVTRDDIEMAVESVWRR